MSLILELRNKDLTEKSFVEIVLNNLLKANIFKTLRKVINTYIYENNFSNNNNNFYGLMNKNVVCNSNFYLGNALDNFSDKEIHEEERRLHIEGKDVIKVTNSTIKYIDNLVLYEGNYDKYTKYKEGLGVEIDFNNYEIYFGEFYKNKKHGKGFHLKFNETKSSEIDQILVENDRANYNNVYKIVTSYKGEFQFGEKKGVCDEEISNKNIYKGNLKGGKMHGLSMLTHLEDTNFCVEGDFFNGLKNGVFKEKWTNYSFKGLYNMGVKEGKGILKTKDFKYKGGFFDNLKHGDDCELIEKGYHYKGSFKNDLKEGFGRQEFTDYVYEGNFSNDLFHGQGCLTYNQEIQNTNKILKFEGEFDQGKKVKGTIYNTSGEKKSYVSKDIKSN